MDQVCSWFLTRFATCWQNGMLSLTNSILSLNVVFSEVWLILFIILYITGSCKLQQIHGACYQRRRYRILSWHYREISVVVVNTFAISNCNAAVEKYVVLFAGFVSRFSLIEYLWVAPCWACIWSHFLHSVLMCLAFVCVATVDDTHKLWRNIEPHLRKCLHSVYLREVTGLVQFTVTCIKNIA